MQIFDYSNGKKGKKLTDIARQDSYHGSIIEQDGEEFRIELTGELFGTYELAYAVSTGKYIKNKPEHDIQISADIVRELGVEAVIYCDGSYQMCGEEVWSWHVTATPEWIRKAHKNGWLTLEYWNDGHRGGKFLEA